MPYTTLYTVPNRAEGSKSSSRVKRARRYPKLLHLDARGGYFATPLQLPPSSAAATSRTSLSAQKHAVATRSPRPNLVANVLAGHWPRVAKELGSYRRERRHLRRVRRLPIGKDMEWACYLHCTGVPKETEAIFSLQNAGETTARGRMVKEASASSSHCMSIAALCGESAVETGIGCEVGSCTTGGLSEWESAVSGYCKDGGKSGCSRDVVKSEGCDASGELSNLLPHCRARRRFRREG